LHPKCIALPTKDEFDEVHAVLSFLCTRYPTAFQRLSPDSAQTDVRNAILVASVVTDSFFLKREGQNQLEPYKVTLERGFASPWANDLETDYPEILSKTKKIVKFFHHWIKMSGYSGSRAEYRTEKRTKEMDQSLGHQVEREMGQELSNVLFVPTYWYSKGERQFRENVYHYIAGMVFREMGYLIIDEYAPTLMTGTARTPDLSTFRMPVVIDFMKALRAKGVIS
jgi:hypothetical protein